MGLYEKRPTLEELYAQDQTCFDDLHLPAGLDLETARTMILTECAQLDTLFYTAYALSSYIDIWSAAQLPGWQRIATALSAQYNPIHNYDRTDVETETTSDSESATGSEESTGTGSSQTESSGTETREQLKAGYNSQDYVASDKEIVTPDTTVANTTSTGLERSTTDSRSRDGERERTLTSSGNIGVTTSQQMIEAEIRLRSRWTLAEIVVQAFKRDLCVGVW